MLAFSATVFGIARLQDIQSIENSRAWLAKHVAIASMPLGNRYPDGTGVVHEFLFRVSESNRLYFLSFGGYGANDVRSSKVALVLSCWVKRGKHVEEAWSVPFVTGPATGRPA